MREPIEVDETGEANGNAIRKLYGEGREREIRENAEELAQAMPIEPMSEMQHVAGAVLRRGAAQANQYGAELVVIAIEREPRPEAVFEGLPAPGYAFGMASTSDDDETIALALRAIARRLERG